MNAGRIFLFSTPRSAFLVKVAGVAQTVQERSLGTTEAVSSILTTGSNISGCRVAATHLPWEQVHAGSIPAIQTRYMKSKRQRAKGKRQKWKAEGCAAFIEKNEVPPF